MQRILTRVAAPALRRSAAPVRAFAAAAADKKTIKVTFIKPSGDRVTVDAPIGDSMLEVAHANNIDIEGACGGETACSTCHIIVDSKEQFDKLPEMAEAEEDMLDLAAGLAETSRLGCQVFAAPELDGLVIRMPKEVNNMLGKD